jgi:hypothetical protein
MRGSSHIRLESARRSAVKPLAAAARPPHRSALSIIAIACVMASLFAGSYSLALGRATPHHIPAALIGDRTTQAAVLGTVERAAHGSLNFRAYPSTAAAARAIDQQKVYAALELAPGRPRLLIASAAGASVARVLTQAAEQLEHGALPALTVVDLHPLPAGDPQGLVSFYVTLAATIVGFLTMFQLRANSAPLGLRAWLGYIAVLAAVGGLLLALITGPVIDALHGPLGELWAALAAEIAVAAVVCSTMIVLFGRWSILPTWLLFVVLGNASSGGAVAPPLLPPFYAFIGGFLPPGATVDTIRTAVYFPGAQHAQPMLVEAAWFACGLAALLLATRLLRRLPGAP